MHADHGLDEGSRTRVFRSIAGPTSAGSSPRARCAPTGLKISRPWKVLEKRTADHPLRVFDVPGCVNAVVLVHQRDVAVIRQNKPLIALAVRHNCPPRTAYRGVDDNDKDRPRRVIGRGASQVARGIQNVERSPRRASGPRCADPARCPASRLYRCGTESSTWPKSVMKTTVRVGRAPRPARTKTRNRAARPPTTGESSGRNFCNGAILSTGARKTDVKTK